MLSQFVPLLLKQGNLTIQLVTKQFEQDLTCSNCFLFQDLTNHPYLEAGEGEMTDPNSPSSVDRAIAPLMSNRLLDEKGLEEIEQELAALLQESNIAIAKSAKILSLVSLGMIQEASALLSEATEAQEAE